MFEIRTRVAKPVPLTSERGPMTAAQLIKHPEFLNVTWKLKPSSSGFLPVALKRGGPIKISWELHGHGPIHLVFVMGLGSFKTSWQRQTKYFGHDRASKYSVLILDNRGMGDSDKPIMRYSTSEMAKDVWEVVDHVGWTRKREIHLLGVSMGGMIAQEMACAQPDRIASLCLISTAARIVNTVGFVQNIKDRVNMFLPKDLDKSIESVKVKMFSVPWLEAPDDVGLFPTNGDNIAAREISKRMDKVRFTRPGFTCQALAAGWHHKSPTQLQQMADRVGRERMVLMHGTLDRMISYPHAEHLKEDLGEGVRFEKFEGIGHVIPMERADDFHRIVSETFEVGEKLNQI